MPKKIHKAKKSLGQNFLKSASALRSIIESGEINPEDIILEIGPGKGALTEKLLERAGTVVAVEKDRELAEFLKEKFAIQIAEKKLILKEDDILDFNVSEFKKYKIIANIPYNITGAILKKFLTEKNQPERMILLVQKEVAERIVARDGKESILSISVKAYGIPKMIEKVPARYFSPAPKVDSAIIAIKNISRKTFLENKVEEEKFWQLVHFGFAHKRKIVAGNLKDFDTGIDWVKILTDIGLNKNSRAEELRLDDWIMLMKMI